jgi:hypothetical protein
MSDPIRDAFGSEPLPSNVEDQIGGIASKIENVIGEMEKAREDDTARWQALNEERKVLADQLNDLQTTQAKADIAAEDAKVREETKALLYLSEQAAAQLPIAEPLPCPEVASPCDLQEQITALALRVQALEQGVSA